MERRVLPPRTRPESYNQRCPVWRRHAESAGPPAVPGPRAIMESSPSTPPASPSLDLSRIAQDLQIRRVQVEQVVQLLDEGNTVPFIARYRRERTGGLPEPIVNRIRLRVGQLKHFAERKQTILKAIEVQGKLTDELRTVPWRPITPSGSKTCTCRSSRSVRRPPAPPATRVGAGRAGHLDSRPGRRRA